MKSGLHPEPTLFVIFGAGGDLAWRKLVPALYNLYLDGWMPEQYQILGVGHGEMSDADYRNHLRKGVNKSSRRGKAQKDSWKAFASRISFVAAELGEEKTYKDLAKKVAAQDKEWDVRANHIYYLALPPSLIDDVIKGLASAKLNGDHARIVVEKPFGRDLESARTLNRGLGEVFKENQIFRIDHYLGKETVQNILAFRFGNTLFEPVWNRRYIDHVQITVAEDVGVGHRGHYYDKAGALRDMIQNHLLQIFCLIAMEAPVSLNDDEVRNKKVDVLRAIRPILPERVHEHAVSGQYGSGWIEGEHVKGYRSEPRVAKESSTETFAALRLFIDNWRWQNVPFYMRTGKRLPSKISEVSIQFRNIPHQTFPPAALRDWHPNRLIIAIQPEEGIFLRFQSKYPGQAMRLSPVMMQFYYRETFDVVPPDAYETLLLDVMVGDATLFMRADQAEAAWSVITPILEAWNVSKPTDFPNYPAGTWGPEEAQTLIAQDGYNWMSPTYLQCQDDTATCKVAMEPGS